MAWGACNGEWVFNASTWPNDVVAAMGSALPVPYNQAAIFWGVMVLTALWVWARPVQGSARISRPVWMSAIWVIPLLLAPPVMSSDPVLYADAGYQVAHGFNPYETGLATNGGPFASYVDTLWAKSGVAYPPLTLLVDAAVVSMTGSSPYFSVIAMRIPALLGVALMAFALTGIAKLREKDPASILWLGVLNPLVIVHFVGGAHNDALMAGVSLVAVWLVLRYPLWWVQWLAAPVCVGVAMALKQQGGLTVVAVAGLPVLAQLRSSMLLQRVWLLGWRTLVASCVAVATFVVITVASGLGFGWINWLSLMAKAGTAAPQSLLIQQILPRVGWLGADPHLATAAVGAVFTVILLVVTAAVLIRFSDRPLHALGWSSLVISVLGQALHPWYVPWTVAVLANDPMTKRQRTWLIVFVVAFMVWNTYQSTVLYKGR